MTKLWHILLISAFVLVTVTGLHAATQTENALQGCACDSIAPPPPPESSSSTSGYKLGMPQELLKHKELLAPQTQSHKIARINLSMAVSLHPKMSLFNFQRMGFYRVEPGLSQEDFDSRVLQLKEATKNPALIKEDIRIKAELQKLGEDLQLLFNEEKTIIPDQMSESARLRYHEIFNKRSDLTKRQQDLAYELKFPEYTAPDVTRSMLAEIENEIINSIRQVAMEEGYTLVLNNSVPSPFGYPVSYHPGTRFSTGPAGIEQALFYAFLHEKSDTDEEAYIKDVRLKNWISMTSRPEAQDMLPIKPWPLVLEGGDCILVKVLKKVYDRYQIAKTTWEHLAKVLTELQTY